jgi:predicted RNA-binding Zn ribbon-like protein
MPVSMRLSEKYSVPSELALLYEFANSLDLRTFVERGATHVRGDELATVRHLQSWMRARRLLKQSERVDAEDHRQVLSLRDALRSFLQIGPENRPGSAAASRLSDACKDFPLVVNLASDGSPTLTPAPGGSGVGHVIAELQGLAESGRLDRLKMCNSTECHWIFFDHSKPANRRWCSSALCGNRQKTRSYRQRRRAK